MLSVSSKLDMLSVVMQCFIYAECRSCCVTNKLLTLSVIMLNAIVLNVIILSVVMLNVAAPTSMSMHTLISLLTHQHLEHLQTLNRWNLLALFSLQT